MQQFLQEDIEGHRPSYKTLIACADDVLEACDSVGVTEGVPELQAETQDLVVRWTTLNEFYRNRRDQVNEADSKVKNYRNLLLPLESSIKKAEKSIEDPHFEGIDVGEGKNKLQNMKVKGPGEGLKMSLKYFCVKLCKDWY